MSGKIWKSGYEEIMETLVASNECVYKGSFIELPFLKIVTWVCFNLSLSLSPSRLERAFFQKEKGNSCRIFSTLCQRTEDFLKTQ